MIWKEFWNRNGWSIILWGSILALFILWCIRGWIHMDGTSSVDKESFWDTFFLNRNTATTTATTTTPPSQSSGPTQVSFGESECKRFLEFYFKRPFYKIRPDFLLNPITNVPLELDCYNEELRLAVEYNGAQHYHFNKMMHKNSKDRFQNQQYRDYIKKTKCQEHGIDLIVVPYTIKREKLASFLLSELRKRGFSPAQET